ncbi:hypothetical protein [Streptomyces sp. NPDC058701]|uniref:hypothetical protein n=1 Tax=Streptomyces sp. NPDC058701 TaxID=3346608 RepID=UPI00364951D5
MTASAVGHLVRAGLLVRLGGDTEFPEVHPDQVETLARRRDLPALLDHDVPLGPDHAAVRLGVRRSDFDHEVASRVGVLGGHGRRRLRAGGPGAGPVVLRLSCCIGVLKVSRSDRAA